MRVKNKTTVMIGLGLVGAFATGSALCALLFQTSSRDPFTLAGVATALALVAALPAWLPARWVSRVGAMDAPVIE